MKKATAAYIYLPPLIAMYSVGAVAQTLDPIAAQAIKRCEAFGFRRGSTEFATCAVEQTRLLTPSSQQKETTFNPANAIGIAESAAKTPATSTEVEVPQASTNPSTATLDEAAAQSLAGGNEANTTSGAASLEEVAPRLVSRPEDENTRLNEFLRRPGFSAAASTVKVCVDKNSLPKTVEIEVSSGDRDFDAFAIGIANDSTYRAGTIDNEPRQGCAFPLISGERTVPFCESPGSPVLGFVCKRIVKKMDDDLSAVRALLPIDLGPLNMINLSPRRASVVTATFEVTDSRIQLTSLDQIYDASPKLHLAVKRFLCANTELVDDFRAGLVVRGVITDRGGKPILNGRYNQFDCETVGFWQIPRKKNLGVSK